MRFNSVEFQPTWLEGPTMRIERSARAIACFNDLAVSALHALNNLNVGRVAVLDLDVHQGDGTATALQHVQEALTVSVHCDVNFPFRKSISDHDLPLPSESGDDALPRSGGGSVGPLL